MKTLLTLTAALICQLTFSQSTWISEIVSFNQGLNNDGNAVSVLRSDSTKCLGQAEASDAYTPNENANYVSLGFRGEITLMFDSAIKNIDGMDLKVHETTFGTPPCKRYPERIELFASQDGCNWYFCGYGCQDSEFDLGELNWAKYVKLIDVSPYGNFDPFGVCDGYDVDAVEGYAIETEMLPTTLVANSAQRVIDFKQGLRKNGTPVLAARSNPINALNIPQGTDVVNFVSLGFGGELTLKFDFTVFNQDGYDFKITETTFGNPQCPQYPERAIVDVSMDGYIWSTVGIVCLDALVELGSIDRFQYIRITDRSAATAFSGTADGYDVDGVVAFTNCGPQLKTTFDDVLTEEEESELVLTPNPFTDKITVNMHNIESLVVYNCLGAKVEEFTTIDRELNVESLPTGVYYIEVNTPQTRSIHKLLKK